MSAKIPRFATTRWSLVLGAGTKDAPARAAALSDLCEAYWYPLYAFLRRDGAPEDRAMDLVQGFLASLLERGEVAASPERGRFRSYLIGALRNYQSNARRAERSLARGGDRRIVSLDDAETRYAREPKDQASPAALFERRWATITLDRALERLEEEYRGRGRERAFEVLRDALTGSSAETYATKASQLGLSESAVKVGIHRMRSRLREFVRDEIAQTVASTDDVEEELGHLFAALAS